ncbi:hypothetical protein SCG7109_AB_00410 [Chlamydiales bacterium SCGC AG-110-M15]|nr:hypothetical protein SCG7109_AB_00410 [Chlamydiales bacterium SCGC AG-110-M15]
MIKSRERLLEKLKKVREEQGVLGVPPEVNLIGIGILAGMLHNGQ